MLRILLIFLFWLVIDFRPLQCLMALIPESHCCWEGRIRCLSAQAEEGIQRSTCPLYQIQTILASCLQIHMELSIWVFPEISLLLLVPPQQEGKFQLFLPCKVRLEVTHLLFHLKKLFPSLSHVTFSPSVFVLWYLKLFFKSYYWWIKSESPPWWFMRSIYVSNLS